MSESSVVNAGRVWARVLIAVSSLVLIGLQSSPVEAQEDRVRPRRTAAPSIWCQQPRVVEGLALEAEQLRDLGALLDERVEARRELTLSYRQARAATLQVHVLRYTCLAPNSTCSIPRRLTS